MCFSFLNVKSALCFDFIFLTQKENWTLLIMNVDNGTLESKSKKKEGDRAFKSKVYL